MVVTFKEALELVTTEHAERGTPFLIEEYLPRILGAGPDDDLPFEEVSNEIVGTSRWSIAHEIVYKHDGRFWEVRYDEPATEYQDWESYGTTVREVEPVEKTIIVYRAVK